MICDVCGRNNADSLTFCQDCGRRLRSPRVVAPTPPSGMAKVELPAQKAAPQQAPNVGAAGGPHTPTAAKQPAASASEDRGSSPSGPPSGRRRPEAPQFSFQPSAPGPEAARPDPARAAAAPQASMCTSCGTPNPPGYRFCVTCGASLKRGGVDAAIAERTTDKPEPAAARIEPAPAPPRPAPKPIASAPLPVPTPIEPAAAIAPSPMIAIDGEKIVGAPVVDIASSGAAPAKLVACARCHGNSIAGTRFCKYCGAPLEETPSGRRAAAPPPAPISSPELARMPVVPTPTPAAPAQREPAPAAPIREAAPAAPIREVAPAPAAPVREPPRPRAAEPQPPPQSPPRTPAPPRSPLPELHLPAFRDSVEPGVRSEVSELAGSPVPEMPVQVPAPRAPITGATRGGRLVVIVEDGSEGRSFSLAEGQLDIGRTDGDIVLEDDLYVSPRHARLRRIDGQWMVRDLDSTNHVYVRLHKPYPLKDADLLLLGLEVLQFQTVSDGERGLGHAIQHGTLLFGSPATPRRARLYQRTVEGIVRDVYHLFRDETVIGRETGDIVFTADPFLSRRHAMIKRNPVTAEFSLIDLESSNGTYVAITGEVGLQNGDFLRIGQHLFRLDLG